VSGIGIAVFFIVWVVIGIGSLVMLIVALLDIVKRPEWQWKLAGLPFSITWFNIPKKLKVVEVAAAHGHYGPGHMTFGGWEPVPVTLPSPAVAPAGWDPDASGQDRLRWWDGAQWTGHTSEGGPPSAWGSPVQAPWLAAAAASRA
jgi:hypothetical protein